MERATQVLVDNLFGGATLEEIAARPEMRYVPAALLQQWKTEGQQFRGPDFDAARGRRFVELRRKLLRALRDAGAGLLLGADAPQVYNVPGYATLRELEALVNAGLSPFQALQAGTRNPALALGLPESFGTIEVGRRADLVAARSRSPPRHPQRLEARGGGGGGPLAAGGGARREARGVRGRQLTPLK